MIGDGAENARTIDAYDGHVREYAAGTTSQARGPLREWLDQVVAGLEHDARILELGSATGRDAAYLGGLGYRVECTDATPAFVDLLRSQGIEARPLNAISDDLPVGLDLVLADAVLLHFTRDQAAHVIAKVHAALLPGGRFAFTLKRGEGQAWSLEKLGVPRFFCYWSAPQIQTVLSKAGFASIDITENRNQRTGTDWLLIIARRP